MSHPSRGSTAKSTDTADRRAHRTSATTDRAFTSSLYPWYYVPGRAYLTEQRLSAKYAKEAQRYQENDQINKYYMKCNSEVKLFSNWQNQRPLVKYRNNEPDALTPFYTDNASQLEMESSIIGKCILKMSGLLDHYEQTSLKCKQNYIDCHLIIKFLFEFMEMYKRVKKKRIQIIAEIQRYLKPSSSYSSMRDPLRQVCFLITEILCFYKQEIFNILKLLKPVYREANFLSEHEQSELDQLNNRCFQIVDMYIQLNDIRNKHFQQMYDEERETAWNQQKKTWSDEILIWDNLLVKLLKSNYFLVKDKLENTLNTQRKHFADQTSKFDQLAAYANEIKHDTTLQTVLYKEVSQLLNQK